MAKIWGIDLGGTKIEGVVVDRAQIAEPLCRIRIDTEAHLGYEHVISQIQSLVQQMAQAVEEQPSVLGFSTPGVLNPSTNTMKNCNTVCLNGQPLKADIERALGVTAVLSNDANCFALAEAALGAAKGSRFCFGVIMGTGVGGGVIVNGTIVMGHHGIAGEWGHNVLIAEGPACYCGKHGCVETIIAGPALEKYYATLSGSNKALADIYKNYLSDTDEHATKTINRLVTNFGKALAVVINILDPDVIVLGGGLSNLDVLYTEGVAEVSKNVFNDSFSASIVKNKLGDSAGVFGAAILADIYSLPYF